MAKSSRPFASEAEMCARFISAVDTEQWTVFAETAGWDILLVRKADGFQIGIEAKLRLNIDVISQALEKYGSWAATRPGPDCRAVLVPESEPGGFHTICQYLGLTIIYVKSVEQVEERKYHRWDRFKVFEPGLPGDRYRTHDDQWFEWAPATRHPLPDYVPDVIAGSPAPIQLTDWKIKAIKIAIILEKRGYLVRADFKHISIDHRRWLPSGMRWLVIEKDGRYARAPSFPDFKAQHPRVYAEIAADYEKWKPETVAPAAPGRQEPLL